MEILDFFHSYYNDSCFSDMLVKSVWLWLYSVFWPSYEALDTDVKSNTSFQVIGAGLSRTGTFSSRIALSTLLGGKCYHGYVASLDGEPEFWQKASKGELSDQNWIDGLEGRGYTAGVGEPINLFFPDLIRIFPRAKVILTTRPAQDWVRSMRRAIIEPRSYLERPPVSWFFMLFGITQAKQSLSQVRSSMAKKWGFDHDLWEAVETSDEAALKYFETWHERVVALVPPERLLIYNVNEGWEPLSKFLNVTPPIGQPFPMINDAETVQFMVKGTYWVIFLVPLFCCLISTCKIRRRLLERSLRKAMSIVKYLKHYYETPCSIQSDGKNVA